MVILSNDDLSSVDWFVLDSTNLTGLIYCRIYEISIEYNSFSREYKDHFNSLDEIYFYDLSNRNVENRKTETFISGRIILVSNSIETIPEEYYQPVGNLRKLVKNVFYKNLSVKSLEDTQKLQENSKSCIINVILRSKYHAVKMTMKGKYPIQSLTSNPIMK